MQKCGILYQSGALFSSMTLAENVALPLQQYSDYSKSMIDDLVKLKLALVGLKGYEDFYPAEISGGMKKRAGLARALALDPEIVYFDEPSEGLDPISSKLLDDLILDINKSLGTTIVIVTHELESIFNIGSNSIFLDAETKQIGAMGNPRELLENPPNDTVYEFLTRGAKKNA
jgi:phospholipid/cholesterol/gamma-HCH transport system ATP-binding protein